MSADNYYMIRKDRQGYFVPVMGFASIDSDPLVRRNCPRFHDFHAALEYASADYTEYGITVHLECYSDALPTMEKDADTGHYPECLFILSNEFQSFDCVCDTIQKDWEEDYSEVAQ